MNNEMIAALLTPLLVVGLICGIVVYPFYRNWIIASKGYDVDGFSWAAFCGVLSFGAFFLVEFNILLGLCVWAGLIVVGGFLRKEKLGLAHGIIITFMQGFSLPGRFLMYVIPAIAAALTHTERQGRKTNADISKARAWETYRKSVAGAQTHDEVVGAEAQYQETMADIKVVHGEAARDD